MKILMVADMHGSAKAFREVKKKSKKVDLIINAGDFSIFEQNIEEFFEEMHKLGKPMILVHGNHEISDDCKVAASLFENIHFIHKKDLVLDGVLFLGYGGGGFARKTSKLEKMIKKWRKIVKKKKPKKVVFVTHAPPYDTKLDNLGGEHAGDKSVRKVIDILEPDLAVSGHLHENSEKKGKVGKTLIINPGPYGMIIDL